MKNSTIFGGRSLLSICFGFSKLNSVFGCRGNPTRWEGQWRGIYWIWWSSVPTQTDTCKCCSICKFLFVFDPVVRWKKKRELGIWILGHSMHMWQLIEAQHILLCQWFLYPRGEVESFNWFRQLILMESILHTLNHIICSVGVV